MSIYERAGEEGAPQTPREEERVREITLLCVWQSTVQVDAGGANGRGRVDAFIQQLVESGPAAGDELSRRRAGALRRRPPTCEPAWATVGAAAKNRS